MTPTAPTTEPITGTGQELYQRARRRIPGGTQLLSKRPEMFLPEEWPSYYSRANGARVWDLDGREYLDMSYSGIGSCTLGYADPDVDEAVRRAIGNGVMTTLNCPEEVELADLLCELHPWAEMVRYARSGGEAMALAVRIGRAATGRDRVAFCGYHGWHDWYLAANLAEDSALDGHLLPGLAPRGVPRGLRGTALPFSYNRLDELEALADAHGSEIGVIVMEPVRSAPPEGGFLEGVRALADRIGAVLVFDEITSGWRLNTGGVHLLYGVTPDIAVFAKGMSNGYPMAAVVGTEPVMEAAQSTFISSTYWTDRVGPTAALATIRKHRRDDVADHLVRIGERMQAVWKETAAEAGVPIHVDGIAPLGHFGFETEHANAARTHFTRAMLERGILAKNACYTMFAHRDEHVETYRQAAAEAFGEVREALDRAGDGEYAFGGSAAHTGFKRLT